MHFLKGFGLFFLYFLFFNCSTIFGQSKKLDIEIDEELKKLLSLKILVNKKNYEKNYYAIQLYNGNYTRANEILLEFKEKFPEWESNLTFETPNYKVRVGNFKDLLNASKELDYIRKLYPSAFLLRPNNL